MGNVQSGLVYRKLAKEIPPVKTMGHDDNWNYTNVGWKVFEDDRDREQFICSLITVATSNGLTKLDDHDFKLLYARREGNEERLVARIVAIKEGVIRAKIEPEMDGVNQEEAFKALRKDVEVKLDRILQAIPDRDEAGSLSVAGSSRTEAPPAYNSPDVGIASRGAKK